MAQKLFLDALIGRDNFEVGAQSHSSQGLYKTTLSYSDFEILESAFHNINLKELHTNPEDILDPTKGRNLNSRTHANVHRKNINSEKQFKKYQEENRICNLAHDN